MGSTVSSRTNAYAASEVCHDTWAWDTPVPRTHAGSTSRAKTFQMPDSRVYSTYSSVPTPQLDSIAQLTPMPRAPPAGKVLATALELRLTTAASRSRSDGSTAQIPNQYEARLAVAAMPMRTT